MIGLTITSSWGNGHATTYRSLARGLSRRGHRVLFLERDKPWYAENRDLAQAPYCDTQLYDSLGELEDVWGHAIHDADLVMVGSYVPDGIGVGALVQRRARGATAFYDIDTPVTLAALDSGTCSYLNPDLIPGFDLYFSFTGGPTLQHLQNRLGARAAHALYCSADPDLCRPNLSASTRWDLGYLGTYSPDRQPTLETLLCDAARALPEGRFAIAGPQYPASTQWPQNCDRIEHLAPDQLAGFYAAQRYTLNVTRADMIQRGWSPSVRLFEAAASGTPIISDFWPGLDTLFEPDQEILIARTTEDVLRILRDLTDDERQAIAMRARARVLEKHTGDHRAAELEQHVRMALATA